MAANSNPKERILETASRLFYVQGYNATGINQILEEANVAKASLYSHYGSKDDLGVAYVKAAREDWFKALNSFVATKSTSKEKLLACFDFLERNLKLNDFRGCRFINLLAEVSDQNAEMRKEIVGHKTTLRSFFKNLVADIIKDKTIANQISDSILLLFEGAIVESKIHLDAWSVKTAKRTANILLENYS
jgi:AcrR family transcriptional regulator